MVTYLYNLKYLVSLLTENLIIKNEFQKHYFAKNPFLKVSLLSPDICEN